MQWGVGRITWSGDWRLTALGVFVICVIAVSYSVEMYFDNGAKKELQPRKGEDESSQKASLLHDVESAAETTAIPNRRQKKPVSSLYAFLAGVSVLVCSVSLVYTNAWVLAQFPHVATYVTIQQGLGFLLALIMVKGFKVVEAIDISWSSYFYRVAPLGVCFTIYLWGSNTAYKYLQPGLIQMIKPIGSCFVFAHACAFGVEVYSRAKALNFFLISCGTLLTAAPELIRGVGGVAGSKPADISLGVCVLVGAYFCDAYYVVSIQRLQDIDFDPLSTFTYVAPIACVCMAFVATLTEPEAIHQIPKMNPWLFLLSSFLAFSFNICVMNFIGKLSATTYVIFDYFKDLIILSVAFFLFSEQFARNELVGYAVVVVGGIVWQHRKLRHLAFAQHNINANARDKELPPSESAASILSSSLSAMPAKSEDTLVVHHDATTDAVVCSRNLRDSRDSDGDL